MHNWFPAKGIAARDSRAHQSFESNSSDVSRLCLLLNLKDCVERSVNVCSSKWLINWRMTPIKYLLGFKIPYYVKHRLVITDVKSAGSITKY